MLYVVIIAALLVIGLLGARRLRQVASAATGKAAFKVLKALNDSVRPMSLTELEQKVPHNSGAIINGLKFLHARQLISSNQPTITNISGSLDSGRYYITSKGRDVIRTGGDFIA